MHAVHVEEVPKLLGTILLPLEPFHNMSGDEREQDFDGLLPIRV